MNANRLLVQRLVGRTLIAKNQVMRISTTPVCGKQKLIDYDKIHKEYARFQKDDGVPVHLKAGTRDAVLYYGNAIATFCLTVYIFKEYYFLIWPPKSPKT